jgi:Ca2+-binding EF-hand superfamily protein
MEFCMMIESFLSTKNDLMTEYMNAIFETYDLDKNGTLEFHEFVRMCSCYSMNRYGDIIDFCFKTFDLDGSGSMTEDEFVLLLKGVAGDDPMFPGNFNDALRYGTSCPSVCPSVSISRTQSNRGTHADMIFWCRILCGLLCRQFDSDGDGLINFKEFLEMCRRYPSVFQPAVRRIWLLIQLSRGC